MILRLFINILVFLSLFSCKISQEIIQNKYSSNQSKDLVLLTKNLGIDTTSHWNSIIVDTVIQVANLNIYSVTPNLSDYSFLRLIDNENHIVQISDLPSDMNRVPYSINTYDRDKFSIIETYYLGGGTYSNTLKVFLVCVDYTTKIPPRVIFNDVIYNYKNTDSSCSSNSYKIKVENDFIRIIKRKNDFGMANAICPDIISCSLDLNIISDTIQLKI